VDASASVAEEGAGGSQAWCAAARDAAKPGMLPGNGEGAGVNCWHLLRT